MFQARWVLVLLVFLVGGCAISPPPTITCNFTRHTLEVDDPPSSAEDATTADATDEAPSLFDVLRAQLRQRGGGGGGGGEDDPTIPSMLFMSGGGQHGAFGADLLHEWANNSAGGKLPEFQVVTGISTGSILATFAFTGDTDDAVDGYSITNETQLLTPYLKRKNGHIELSSVRKLLKHGAVANLVPLRHRMAGYLTDEVLGRVRDGHLKGGKLYIGAVDVDTGQAVALDLTEMGARYFTTDDPARRASIKQCYIEAVAASSSAPMAAVPVFIDNRMYVDGGARFGMFSEEIGNVIVDQAEAFPNPDDRANIFLIANGDQEVSPKCGKQDSSLCTPEEPTGGLEGAHKKWTFIDLAMRSEGILVNQVYRFSADKVRTQALLTKSPFRFAKIDSDIASHFYTLTDLALLRGLPDPANNRRTCPQWTEADTALLHPLQFYPRYMRCLIDYGRMRADKDGWGTS